MKILHRLSRAIRIKCQLLTPALQKCSEMLHQPVILNEPFPASLPLCLNFPTGTHGLAHPCPDMLWPLSLHAPCMPPPCTHLSNAFSSGVNTLRRPPPPTLCSQGPCTCPHPGLGTWGHDVSLVASFPPDRGQLTSRVGPPHWRPQDSARLWLRESGGAQAWANDCKQPPAARELH